MVLKNCHFIIVEPFFYKWSLLDFYKHAYIYSKNELTWCLKPMAWSVSAFVRTNECCW